MIQFQRLVPTLSHGLIVGENGWKVLLHTKWRHLAVGTVKLMEEVYEVDK